MLSYNVIVADDARFELQGKTTIVGLYSEIMLVPHFPLIIPKIAFIPSISGKGKLPERIRYIIEVDENNRIDGEVQLSERDDFKIEWRTLFLPPLFMQCIEIKEERDVVFQAFIDNKMVLDKIFPIKLNPEMNS